MSDGDFPGGCPDTIRSERLELRPWQAGDADDVFAYASDPEWSKFLRVLPTPYRREDAETFLVRQADFDRRTHPSWAITLDGHAVGGVNLRVHPQHRLAEMGYSIARRLWGRGYCTEAARAVVDAAFVGYPRLNRIRAMADRENVASQRVLEKLGMQREGILRQNRIEGGVLMDETWWGLLRSEWESGR